MIVSCNMIAQKALLVQRVDGVTYAVATAMIDSLSFSDDGKVLLVAANDTVMSIRMDSIATLSYGEVPEALSVSYEESKAKIVNPYFTQGVSVVINGADVQVDNTNTADELTFMLTGSTSNGSFLYNGSHKATIVLNGVSITSAHGPAIDIECGKRIALELKKNTVNTLADGAGGDWKAALYCKGHLEIDKAGTLTVTGNTKHAISSKEYLQLKKADGVINILGAKGDGIHCGQYFLANGYTVNISNIEGDGIQAEKSGDADYAEDFPDGSIVIQGGSISIKNSSEDAKGLKADADIIINNVKSVPEISISMSGAGGKGMKADGAISIGDEETHEGPLLTVATTGARSSSTSSNTGNTGGNNNRPGGGGWGGGFWGGGGGGSASSGSSAKAIKAQGVIHVYGGEINVTTAKEGAEGIESKASVSIDGGKLYMKCYDDAINSSGSISFNGGISVCISTGNDAIDSNYGRSGAIVIGDGVVLTYTTKGSPEMGFDCDNNSYIRITGKGIAISGGGTQGGSSSATLSGASQGYAFVTSSISYQPGRYYTLADSSGKNLITYSVENSFSSICSLITASGMTKGASYTLKYSSAEPTDAATAFRGVYLGSSAEGTTNVASFTAK